MLESVLREKGEVLVVDDEPSVADALRLILEEQGFVVCVAGMAREGLAQARKRRFRLAIIDLRLPDMTGIELLKAICRESPQSALILITSCGTPEIFAEAKGCGASGFLSKPFPPSDILRLISAVLADSFSPTY